MAWAAAVADTPASNKVTGLSGEVMFTSNAAVLPKNQLGSKMSAGQVLLWSLLRLLLMFIIVIIMIIIIKNKRESTHAMIQSAPNWDGSVYH